jgi:hypothetical protein
MNSIKKIMISLSLVLIAAFAVPTLRAENADWPTRVNFLSSVQIGDLILRPGNYELQLTRGTTHRGVVMIYDLDHGKWVGMVQGIYTHRDNVSGDMAEFTFEKDIVNGRDVMTTWFYPDWNRGVRFVYPYKPTYIAQLDGSPIR